ncbi:MAG: hypothetical protein M0Q19_07570 [Candidatus Cloacimonetes bacterium]|nr:hypothetical protein [Candidatus Cloacimonadota bacterium]MCK9333019.1 hypothetical protein [Candidatus Cloacimonadota bacterium]MDD3379324.1 hypothetical protein [Candidatus Methanomethylophilaceae archaeon]
MNHEEELKTSFTLFIGGLMTYLLSAIYWMIESGSSFSKMWMTSLPVVNFNMMTYMPLLGAIMAILGIALFIHCMYYNKG